MKILIIHNRYQQSGGEETAVDAQIHLLHNQGHEVILYQRENEEINSFNLFRKIAFIFDTLFSLKTVRDINRIVKTQHPQIAHVHNVFPLISPSVYWILKKLGIPIVQTIHNFRFLCPNGLFYTQGRICERCKNGNMVNAVRLKCYRNNYLLSALYALSISFHRRIGTLNKISKFIVLNLFTAEKMIEGGITTENKLEVIPHFQPYVPSGTLKNPDDILYLGRLSPEKGIDTLLESLEFIPKFHLHIIGVGPQETKIREQAAGFGKHVSFEGYITGERKWEFLQKAQIVVIPSKCYEQFGLSALEAMASATAVIASNMGGLPSLIQDGVNGLLFESGNSKDLATKICYLLNDPDIAKEMGLRGRQMIQNKFSTDVYATKLMKIYRRSLKIIEQLL